MPETRWRDVINRKGGAWPNGQSQEAGKQQPAGVGKVGVSRFVTMSLRFRSESRLTVPISLIFLARECAASCGPCRRRLPRHLAVFVPIANVARDRIRRVSVIKLCPGPVPTFTASRERLQAVTVMALALVGPVDVKKQLPRKYALNVLHRSNCDRSVFYLRWLRHAWFVSRSVIVTTMRACCEPSSYKCGRPGFAFSLYRSICSTLRPQLDEYLRVTSPDG
jgi:hypothetical protein